MGYRFHQAEVNKSDKDETITFTNGENSLRFLLNEEEDKAILEIDGKKIHNYILRKENNKRYFYDKFSVQLSDKQGITNENDIKRLKEYDI